MSSKHEKEKQKHIQDKCQRLLSDMLKDDDNKYCVDCDAKGPRWASWNIGIFLCIRCAGIHRNLGVHISKVKSVNLDSWTPQQVVCLQQMGNSRARAVYEANLPDNFRRPQTDSSLEAFIRSKYEQKKYIAREWVQPTLPKVSWDKEIEEEMEKMKKKKREVKSNSRPLSTPPTAVPQPLPKPLSSSPKVQTLHFEQRTTDLLGLDTPTKETPGRKISDSDLFSNFMSSSEGSTTESQDQNAENAGTAGTRTKEEENFFNQTTVVVPSVKQKQLTKDSILALYGTPSTFNNSAPGITSQPFNVSNGTSSAFNLIPGGSSSVVQNGFPANNGTQNTATMQGTALSGFISNPFYPTATTSQIYADGFTQQKLNQHMGTLSLNASANQSTSRQSVQQQHLHALNTAKSQNAFNHSLSSQWQ